MKITPNSGTPVYALGDGPLFSVDADIEPELSERYSRATREYQTVQGLLEAKYFSALGSPRVVDATPTNPTGL